MCSVGKWSESAWALLSLLFSGYERGEGETKGILWVKDRSFWEGVHWGYLSKSPAICRVQGPNLCTFNGMNQVSSSELSQGL